MFPVFSSTVFCIASPSSVHLVSFRAHRLLPLYIFCLLPPFSPFLPTYCPPGFQLFRESQPFTGIELDPGREACYSERFVYHPENTMHTDCTINVFHMAIAILCCITSNWYKLFQPVVGVIMIGVITCWLLGVWYTNCHMGVVLVICVHYCRIHVQTDNARIMERLIYRT